MLLNLSNKTGNYAILISIMVFGPYRHLRNALYFSCLLWISKMFEANRSTLSQIFITSKNITWFTLDFTLQFPCNKTIVLYTQSSLTGSFVFKNVIPLTKVFKSELSLSLKFTFIASFLLQKCFGHFSIVHEIGFFSISFHWKYSNDWNLILASC